MKVKRKSKSESDMFHIVSINEITWIVSMLRAFFALRLQKKSTIFQVNYDLLPVHDHAIMLTKFDLLTTAGERYSNDYSCKQNI